MEAEKLDRRSMSPEHTSAARSSDKSSRSSQLAKSGCWHFERRSDRDADMEEYRDATGSRRMRVKAT